MELGLYKMGVNLPYGKQGTVWEHVQKVSRWGAKVVELNTNAERMGKSALNVLKQLKNVNELEYTWHVPPNERESGELAMPHEYLNKFARKILEGAIKSAIEVNARHITIHPTNKLMRVPDGIYIYDELNKELKLQRKKENMSEEEQIKMLDETMKARIRTEYEKLKTQLNLIKSIEDSAKEIRERGISEDSAKRLAYLTIEATKYGQVVGLSPERIADWVRIQNKVLRGESLNEKEKKIVEDYSSKVMTQIKNQRTLFENQLKEYEEYVKKDKIIRDGREVMIENVAKNIAKLDKDLLQKAVKNNISLGFENLSKEAMFSLPEELIELRKKTVEELVKAGKLTKEQAEKFVGFTFDFAHAITIKNFEIGGKDFSVEKFIEKLGKNIKHIHATDTIGVEDAHLPLGQGEVNKEMLERIKKALEKSGFKGTVIHELGQAGIPQLYMASLEAMHPEMLYTSNYGRTISWGPSYLAASMTDPLLLGKEGYFYESFADIF